MWLLYFYISLIVVIPVLTLINLLGHSFFVKLFGGTVDKLILGSGKPLVKIGKLEIRTLFLNSGWYLYSNVKIAKSYRYVLLHIGGFIFNLLFSILLFIFTFTNIIYYNDTLGYYICSLLGVSIFYTVLSIIPLSSKSGDSDAKQIYLYFKYKNIDKLANNANTLPMFIEKIDREIARLAKMSENSPYNFMIYNYIRLVLRKAYILENIGELNKAVETLFSFTIDNYKDYPDFVIAYYNDLLYYFLLLNNQDEADKIYYKLNELFEENSSIAISPSTKDTFATYEFFKGNFDESKKMFLEIMSSTPEMQGHTCNYFLSQIYIKEGKPQDAIKLLNNIDASKVGPYLFNKANMLKASLETN